MSSRYETCSDFSVPYVYILRCADNALYIGSTANLSARMERHRAGNASRFTAARRPVTLVYSECFSSARLAGDRERQLKRWTRAKKEALIAGNAELLKRLATAQGRGANRRG